MAKDIEEEGQPKPVVTSFNRWVRLFPLPLERYRPQSETLEIPFYRSEVILKPNRSLPVLKFLAYIRQNLDLLGEWQLSIESAGSIVRPGLLLVQLELPGRGNFYGKQDLSKDRAVFNNFHLPGKFTEATPFIVDPTNQVEVQKLRAKFIHQPSFGFVLSTPLPI